MNLTESIKSQIFSVLTAKLIPTQCELSSVSVFVHLFLIFIHSRTSANGILKTMHTGVDSYRKTRADGHVTLSNPHVTFLGASNGVSKINFQFFINSIKIHFSYRT